MVAMDEVIYRIIRSYLSSVGVANIKPAKVENVFDDNEVLVKVLGEVNSIRVVNLSGKKLSVGDEVRICYTGLSIQPNNAFVLTGGAMDNSEIIYISGNETNDNAIYAFDILSYGSQKCILNINMCIVSEEDMSTEISIWLGDVKQSYSAIVDLNSNEHKNLCLTIPIALVNGTNVVSVKMSEPANYNINAFISGQNIKELE